MGRHPLNPRKRIDMITFDVTEFLEANRIASAEGGGSQAVADLLGLTLGQVHSRRHSLKRKGIRLPTLRRRAAKVARRSRHESTNLHFSFDVGG